MKTEVLYLRQSVQSTEREKAHFISRPELARFVQIDLYITTEYSMNLVVVKKFTPQKASKILFDAIIYLLNGRKLTVIQSLYGRFGLIIN